MRGFVVGTGGTPRVAGRVALRDAQAAAYAADGYARRSGETCFVACAGITEALEAAPAALTAWSDRIPVIYATRVARADAGRAREAFAAVVRGVRVVESEGDVERVAEEVGRAIGRERPLHLLVTAEVDLERLLGALERVPGAPVGPAGSAAESAGAGAGAAGPAAGAAGPGLGAKEPAPADVRAAAELLSRSRRPVLLAGSGAIGHATIPVLVELAERLGAPVLLTASATTAPAGVLEAFGRAASGRTALIPSGPLPWSIARLGADAVLALGSALSEVDGFGLTEVPAGRAPVVQVALDPAPGAVRGVELHVEADAGRFAGALLDELSRGAPPARDVRDGRSRWGARWLRAAGRWRRLATIAPATPDATPLDAGLAARLIVARAPADTVFVGEGGSSGMWLWALLWLRPLVFPVQNGTIGVTVPMALGAHAAGPAAPVWGIVGDGAYFYNARELATASELGLPLVFFVFNDSSWGAIRIAQTMLYSGRYAGTDLPPADYAGLAGLHGCEGRVARTAGELEVALARAREPDRTRPLVVDLRVAKDAVPPAGMNFVLAELDGAMRPLALQAAAGGLLAAARGKVPRELLRSLARGAWETR